MSFQAYLDAIEDKSGRTPAQLLAEAASRGYDSTTQAAVVAAWLNDEYGIGRGHAAAFLQVLKNGPVISDKHVGTSGSHRDASNLLLLDGKAQRPAS